MMHIVYLSLGTNLGDKEKNLTDAIRMIGQTVGTVVRQSSFLATEPWGFDSENGFLNCAICINTTHSPLDVLHLTQEIERKMGRQSKSIDGIYHDRIIDIDILLYDDLRMNTPLLTIPHPLMKKRDFVMIPLKEIQ